MVKGMTPTEWGRAMNRIRMIVTGVLVCLVCGIGSAQDRELTVEELYLRQIEFQIMKEKAFTGDLEMKEVVLDDLEEMIEESSVGQDNDDVQYILEYLGMEGTTNLQYEGRRVVNNYPQVRRKSAELLGKLGGERAKDTLITMLLRDDEPMVKAEAAFALGVIGLNEKNEVVQALVHALDQQDFTNPDNNFALAVVNALDRIAQQNNGINDPDAFRMLVRIAQGGYVKDVRARALMVLDSLRRYE